MSQANQDPQPQQLVQWVTWDANTQQRKQHEWQELHRLHQIGEINQEEFYYFKAYFLPIYLRFFNFIYFAVPTGLPVWCIKPMEGYSMLSTV